jgi:tRNA threonylcarbamoyladenosine biosynthesis protein TsaE
MCKEQDVQAGYRIWGRSSGEMTRVETDSATETETIGAELAQGLRPGDVVLISGEMGSGKTTLIRGACRALGVTGPVTSPTFTIGRRYEGQMPIAHLDLHRLATLDGEDPGLLDDYTGPDVVTFVEWPEVAEPVLDGVRSRVRMEHVSPERRRVIIQV